MTICERPEGPPPRCQFNLQDADGAVASYGGAILHVTSTPDGLVSILVKEANRKWVRRPEPGSIERDLVARIEAALAILEDGLTGSAISVPHVVKILKGKL